MERTKKTYDNEYVDNENVGDAYTNLEISSAEANLESRYKQIYPDEIGTCCYRTLRILYGWR